MNDEGTTAEILFIKRASRATDKVGRSVSFQSLECERLILCVQWSGHMAFPGGRQEAEDEDERYTAMRETWEEVGLDLAEKEWLAVGQLDDREITTSLGKRLLMILSPFGEHPLLTLVGRYTDVCGRSVLAYVTAYAYA